MEKLHEYLQAAPAPAPCAQNVILAGNTRISVLLERVIRIEHGTQEGFTDAATQSVWYRDHGAVEFQTEKHGAVLTVQTAKASFAVNTVSGKLLYAVVDGKRVRPCRRHNLKGTARTLDATFGPIPLKDGVLSSDGVALLDDSKSLLLDHDGMVTQRPANERDVYVFAFGDDYIGAVRALFAITGSVPLVPRFALGNWWSRYYPYSQAEYENLMLEFARKDIPLTVATVDMDWHWVDLEARFHEKFKKTWGSTSGWTGYSWNTDLFPDPKGFLQFLHAQNLKVTLNLHPADGFRWFEDCYPEMAKAMGVDAEKREPVEFDIADPKFINSYLDIGHHPYEADGVDFWWIDWQQGTKSKLAGLDPLWSLNHYHYLDNGRDAHRPMILSRYAGIGSHRYPLGFSGDTAMNWRVLRFQPYFTATATNCGYTWWSHDIGGHHFGEHSDELYVRWVQFGVFAPILRLHSTSNDLFGKEPWNYAWAADTLATKALRLRHALIPYIYAMNYRTHAEGRALCEPLYYTCPKEPEAYRCKNGYLFGSEMLVCPVTSRRNARTKVAATKVYLPEGRWTHFFTGAVYKGGRTVCVHSDMDSIPVFAKAGAIIPLSGDAGNSVRNPEHMQLRLYRGNNTFTLYEDDGETCAFRQGDFSKTEITLAETEKTLTLCISGGAEKPYMPQTRTWTLRFADVADAAGMQVTANGNPIEAQPQTDPDTGLTVTLPPLPVGTAVTVTLEGVHARENPPYKERVRNILTHFNANNMKKSATYAGLKSKATLEETVAAAKRVKNRALRAQLLEALCDME